MSSKSARQHRFMEIAAHDPRFARDKIPVKVAKEFLKADAKKAAAKGKAK
jgi:hypothetical protein